MSLRDDPLVARQKCAERVTPEAGDRAGRPANPQTCREKYEYE